MILLLPISFIIIYVILWLRSGNPVRVLADSWLFVSLFVMIQTEALSLFHVWTNWTVAISWLVLLLSGVIVIYYRMKKGLLAGCSNREKQFREKIIKYRIWLIAFLVYFCIVLLTAILSGQSNVDSLIYHLPRIMHWIQNKSVGHYATSTDLQIRYPALAEYLVSQIYLLGASDRLANLVQTGAYMSSAVLVFGISRRLGTSVKFSFVASGLYILMPMAMVQAFTTQTDDVAGMFLLIFIYLILDFIQVDKLWTGRQIITKGMQLSVSVVLGYLCKPTICFAMVVFFLWMCLTRLYKKDRFRILFQYLLTGTVTAMLLFAPLLLKSYHTYMVDDQAVVSNHTYMADNHTEAPGSAKTHFAGSPANAIAPDSFNVVNAAKDPKIFFMTCLQNAGRNIASNSFPQWNDFIIKVVNKAAGFLDYDVSKFSLQEGMNFFECDTASNPAIMCFGILAFVCAFVHISKISKEQRIYIVCAFISLILQCGLMGYTAFRTRYLVGVLAILCPAIVIIVSHLRFRERVRESVALICIVVACFGGINTFVCEMGHVQNGLRGNNIHQYFRINLREQTHVLMTEYINSKGYTNIGVEGKFSYEYVLWKGIDNLERLESVNVKIKPLRKYEDEEFIPECIVEETQEPKETVKSGKYLECHGIEYECTWTMYGNSCHYSVYTPVIK